MLFAERRRLAVQAEAESRGEVLWTDLLDTAVRAKLAGALSLSCPEDKLPELSEGVQSMALHHLGVLNPSDIRTGILRDDESIVLSYVEAAHRVLSFWEMNPPRYSLSVSYRPGSFEARVNDIFNAHRISYRMVEGEIVPLDAEELHVEVVEPTLRLLHGERSLTSAHDAYLKALKEISNNDAPDAITDAGTALQEALSALGCQGNALGPLIADAKKRGLLAPHDGILAAGIAKFLDWVSANRSEDGDAHKSSPAELNDAWLMVHIVGALIVRLFGTGSPRREPSTSVASGDS